jgi:nucleosome binding factor SPN SPT16 subunit
VSQTEKNETAEHLQSHQEELEEKMRLDALERIARQGGGGAAPSASVETPIAYRNPDHFPQTSSTGGSLKTNQTHVDGKNEALLVPMFGRLVPFHISTIKNVSKSEEGAFTHLRINFVAPGQSISSQQMPKEADPDAHFIRELSFKARQVVDEEFEPTPVARWGSRQDPRASLYPPPPSVPFSGRRPI